MKKVRVLAVDDSAIYRAYLKGIIDDEDEFQLVGLAKNGKEALALLEQNEVDVIILDIHMPVMTGLETLPHLKERYPSVNAIMFSSYTADGAKVTFEALSLGAKDYVCKPTSEAGAKITKEQVKEELIQKIKGFSGLASLKVDKKVELLNTSTFTKPEIITIGSSTGGPKALEVLFKNISGNIPVPIVMVQHMPPLFTEQLAKNLDTLTPVKVVEGQKGMEIEANHAYLAPGGFHMTLVKKGGKTCIDLNEGPLVNHCRPAVDVLFQSTVEIYKAKILAIQLTGMGVDGMRGAEMIAQNGGEIFAQDEESSVVWSMPKSVIDLGVASRILPPDQLGKEIVQKLARHYLNRAV